jgi:glycerol-3-phosphate acyltransferase PlsY
MITLLAIILVSYIVGSFPSGIVLGKALKGIDIREQGSKNMGATNVLRVLGPKVAIPVLLLDMIKGAVAVILFSHINLGDLAMDLHWLKLIAGIAAIFGHIFSIWVKFKGGKGVATGAGVLFGLMPLEAGFAILLFILVVSVTRYVSLGSILATIFILVSLLAEIGYLGVIIPKPYMVLAILLVILILFTHRQNVGRLIRGEENKIGRKNVQK